MSSVELQKFLEDRLVALDPGIDISAGSPAQTKFISPVLEYLGTDPFETDIKLFILDRFAQDFPDIYAADPGALNDLFVKPLQLILDPLKREIQTVRRNQSLIDPSLLSDEDADSLVANVFDSRDRGGYSNGVVRVYFPTPTDTRVEVTNRVFDTANRSFFPTSPVSLTAELMSFNRDGALFYMDIPVRAEKPGSDYNVEAGEVIGIEGLPNIVRATNLRKFSNGAERQDNVTFVAAAETALSERSLSNRRGTVARLNTVFQGQLRSVQVVGARDPEMQRDLLVTTSPGHIWATGAVTLYADVALVLARTIDGPLTSVPKVGETLYVYLSGSGVSQENRVIRLRIDEVLYSGAAVSSSYAYSYFLRWSDPEGALERVLGAQGAATFLASCPVDLEGGLAKPGDIKISSVPDVGEVDISVPSGSVHVYGHADIYVRPAVQDTSVVTVGGVYDLGKDGSTVHHPHFYIERLGLVTTAGSVLVGDSDNAFDFVAAGVSVGDVLRIEGDEPSSGLYSIMEVAASTLSLNRSVATSGTVRYRVMRSIRINPFAPVIPKFPFGDLNSKALSTTIGVSDVVISNVDLRLYATVGDTLEILEGEDSGTYLITAFTPVGVTLDQKMSSSGGPWEFKVYYSNSPVLRPLVRIKELLLLDSAQQSTGVTIPHADPVAVTPVGPFTSASVLASSRVNSGYVLPDLAGRLFYTNGSPLSNHAAAGGGRYSGGFDSPDGTYISTVFENSTQAELDLRSDTSGKTSFFLATVEVANDDINYPPIDPNPGECLSIKSGPNKGDYLIRAVHKFKYSIGTGSSLKTMHCYFIQIYESFPADPIGQLLDFLKYSSVATGLEVTPQSFPLPFPSFFVDFYDGLPAKIQTALIAAGSDASAADLTAITDSICSCSYEWGVPAHGTLRTFYREPTLFEQWTGSADRVTTFSHTTDTGDVIKFRPDPNRYLKYEIIPPRVSADAAATSYPTDLVTAVKLQTSGGSGTTPVIGEWVTGTVSKASGKVIAVAASSLTLSPVYGAFNVSEPVTATGGYSATAVPSTSPIVSTANSSPSLYAAGVRAGDYLAVHEEIPVISGAPSKSFILQTAAGSPIVKLVESASLNIFPATLVGCILRIEQGNDAGNYRVVRVIDASTLMLDRVLTTSTETVISSGINAAVGLNGTDINVVVQAGLFSSSNIGQYMTLYGVDYRWVGSFPIKAVGVNTVTLELPSPDSAASDVEALNPCRWAFVGAQLTAPTAVSRGVAPNGVSPRGTTTLGGVPFRLYEQSSHDFAIESVTNSDTVSAVTLADGIGPGMGVTPPYRVYRKNVRRLTPTEMSSNKEGFLSYFDTEVVSLSPTALANIPKETYLVPVEGTYKSLGYRHVVTNPNFSYSTQEEGFLDLPLQVMTEGSSDSVANLVSIVGAPVQVTYEQASLVSSIQEFASSATERPVAANLLVRHFLPAYVSYDAVYEGGADPSVIAKDIRTYLDQIPIETPIDVSEIEKLITGRGGNPITPTTVIATIHDWDRKMWAEFSQNSLGGPNASDTKVPYNGSPRVTFFLPTKDVSGQDPIPAGERINLVRR